MNDKWIPVGERLPYCNDWYQTTVIATKTQKLVMDLYYKNGKWLDNRRIDMYDTYEIHGYGKTGVFHEMNRDEFDEFDWTDAVIAWMPLPDAYEPQESERRYNAMSKKEVKTKRIAEGFRGGKVPPIKPEKIHWESEQDKNEAMANSLGHMLDGLAMDISCE